MTVADDAARQIRLAQLVCDVAEECGDEPIYLADLLDNLAGCGVMLTESRSPALSVAYFAVALKKPVEELLAGVDESTL